MSAVEDHMQPIEMLDKDILKAIKNDEFVLSRHDVRYIVNLYYDVQQVRVGSGNRVAASKRLEEEEPTLLTTWMRDQLKGLEKQIIKALAAWTEVNPVAKWAKSQKGVGPVLAAGLAAHIDITKAPTVGRIWRFAGLDPTVEWHGRKKTPGKLKDLGVTSRTYKSLEMIQAVSRSFGRNVKTVEANANEMKFAEFSKWLCRRPWNARLKNICWKIGDSFVKNSNRDCLYGAIYRTRKLMEVERNERGDNKAAAARSLEEKNISDSATKKNLEAGRLPDGQIDLRARRYAVKLFLAHWHEVAYREEYDKDPPKPYVIEHLGHVDYIPPPMKEAQ